MAYVLLLGDTTEARRVGSRLRQSGYDVFTIPRMDAETIVSRRAVLVVLADTLLPETWNRETAATILKGDADDMILVVTNLEDLTQLVHQVGSASAATSARASSDDYVKRETRTVLRLEGGRSRTPDIAREPRPHAAARWARAVVRIIESPEDLRTVVRWSRWNGVSAGALRDWCDAAGIKPRLSLVFGRLLRVAVLCEAGRGKPEELLDVVDQRTLSALMKLAGVTASEGLPRTVEDFLNRQMLVRDERFLREVRSALEEFRSFAPCASQGRA